MVSMPDKVISPGYVIKVVFSYTKSILVTLLFAMGLVYLAYVFVPRTYTSETTIHIAGNYFQNPLLGDLVSQIYDPSEVREEREKIIRGSLGTKFANESGEKYQLFKTAADSPDRPVEVENFLKGVTTFAMTPTQFKIRLKARSPEAADGMIRDAVEAVRGHMYLRRTRMLQGLLEVLDNEIVAVSGGNGVPGVPKENPVSPTDAMKAAINIQVKRLEEHLNDLRRNYNDQHPAIQKVKNDIANMRARARGSLVADAARAGLFERELKNSANAPGSGTKDELIKRHHMVNMSYEMEKRDPSMSAYVSVVEEPTYPKRAPKRRIFIIGALIAAVLSVIVPPAMGEYWRRMPMSPEEVAEALHTKILGQVSS
jgi:hypothetical protein